MADVSSSATESHVITEKESGQRLDQVLAQLHAEISRVKWTKWIQAKEVFVNQKAVKASHKVSEGETIQYSLPEIIPEGPKPEPIALDLLFEDEYIAVINKPPGMVVHPAKGHWSGTLASALQYHFDQLSEVGGAQRPGIVHRLDRDTSGVMVVAKDDQTHQKLSALFQERKIQKEYRALALGRFDRDRDWIRGAIAPHPHQRERMAIRPNHPASREAETFYEVIERFSRITYLRLLPKTGRTHQIRVHLESLKRPILCDRLYGSSRELWLSELDPKAKDDQKLLSRQALHAYRLAFRHPRSEVDCEYIAPLPADMQAVLQALRQDSSAG
ncbi:Ribosomal large subunit pseudouridine synthase D [Planctomycetales bacterium 10988]|nr:Ribosomal large subunit pseudouridine synthase D [Planctomycetales bacterium 10988]